MTTSADANKDPSVRKQEEEDFTTPEATNVSLDKEDDTEKGEGKEVCAIPMTMVEHPIPTADDFNLPVDPDQDFKAKELKLCSFQRPHMRAFHYAWWSFFIAFFIWFSIAPLLPEIRITLDLSPQDIWITNIVAVSGDIVMRFVFGALTDKLGARILMGAVLMLASIPTACTGLVNSLLGLVFLRLFIGLAGSSFVMCQCWTTRMFTKEIVGTANALVGGWGNCGGGVTQIVMGSALFPLFRDVVYKDKENAAELAWRTVCLVPAFVAFTTGFIVIMTSDDCPEGNYKQLKKTGRMPQISAAASFRKGAVNFNTWLLYIQYGCCFGVELTMNNAAATYFVDEFDLSTETAAAIASVFGFMNIFARGLGGYCSDKAMARMGMRGRIWAQLLLLLLEGLCILLFATMESLWAAILLLTIFSIFVQGAEGSTYGIVPYVNLSAPGAVAGIVGAGGPSGAVAFGFGFLFLNKTTHAYFLMGSLVILSAISCFFFNIKGHGGILFQAPAAEEEAPTALEIPEKVLSAQPSSFTDDGGVKKPEENDSEEDVEKEGNGEIEIADA